MKRSQKKLDQALWNSPFCSLNEARLYAVRVANQTMLPQTLFRDPTEGPSNWRNAAALAPLLDRRRDLILWETIIPEGYFN